MNDKLVTFAGKHDLNLADLGNGQFCLEAVKGEILLSVEQELKKAGFEILATGKRNGNEYKMVRAK